MSEAINAAYVELGRLESLLRRGKIKSTADWWNLANARERVEELEAAIERMAA